jgi:hypothetical protein
MAAKPGRQCVKVCRSATLSTSSHGLEVDDSRERLAIGSTTGALWISDKWRRVPGADQRDPPPIYAVQFANK